MNKAQIIDILDRRTKFRQLCDNQKEDIAEEIIEYFDMATDENEQTKLLKLIAELREVFTFSQGVDIGAIVSCPTECLLTMIEECKKVKS